MGIHTSFRMEKTMNCEKNERMFQNGLEERRERIEELLKEYLPEATGPQQVIMEAMEYSMLAGG